MKNDEIMLEFKPKNSGDVTKIYNNWDIIESTVINNMPACIRYTHKGINFQYQTSNGRIELTIPYSNADIREIIDTKTPNAFADDFGIDLRYPIGEDIDSETEWYAHGLIFTDTKGNPVSVIFPDECSGSGRSIQVKVNDNPDPEKLDNIFKHILSNISYRPQFGGYSRLEYDFTDGVLYISTPHHAPTLYPTKAFGEKIAQGINGETQDITSTFYLDKRMHDRSELPLLIQDVEDLENKEKIPASVIKKTEYIEADSQF